MTERTFTADEVEAMIARALSAAQPPLQKPVATTAADHILGDVAIRGDMARAVFDAIRFAVPSLGPWHAFDAREVQRMADALKPFMQAPHRQHLCSLATARTAKLLEKNWRHLKHSQHL